MQYRIRTALYFIIASFLAVVFGVGGKPGTVWFYTKQAAIALAALLPKTKSKFASQDELNVATDFNNIVQRQS